MPNPAGSLLPRMRSLGRRKSKTARQQFEAEITPGPASTPALVELDGTQGVELTGSLPAGEGLRGAVAVADGSPTDDRRGSTGARGVLAQDLPRLQSLQQQYLAEPDGRPHAAISQQLDSVESRVADIIGHYIDRVQQSKHLPGGEARIKDVEELVFQFRASESNWIAMLQSNMERAYQRMRPQSSDDSNARLFDDFDVRISQLDRNCHTPEDRAIVWVLRDRYQTMLDAKSRLSALDYRWANVLAETVLAMSQPSLRKLRTSGIPTVIIASSGDTVLELGFPPCFKFRVSSQVLSQASPFFEYALKPYRQDQIDARSSAPSHAGHDLGGPEFIRTSLTMPMTLRLRMDRHITVEAVSILLHAAHMQPDKVPRRVSFQDFVDIAFACHKYRCTAPVEIYVEGFWLEQWHDRLMGEGYEDFLFISYVFGLERIFQKTSKAALMKMCDRPGDAQEDSRLPQDVWLRLRETRIAKLKKVLQLSRRTLDSYLLGEDTSAARARRSISISDAASVGEMDELQLKRQPRCPHGSHECDAANLGWFMLVLNEVGLLPVVLDPTKEDDFFKYQAPSLKKVLCKLCAAPSAAGVHGASCDYAPVFRNAVCDIYNGIRGLSIWDVNDRLTGRRHTVIDYMGGDAADESMGTEEDISGAPPAPSQDRPLVGSGDRAMAGGSSSVHRLSQQSNGPSEGNTSVETVSDGNTEVTELSRESRGSRLSRQNLQALDADTRSVVSTEVDSRTDRCTSPTLTMASVRTLLHQPDSSHVPGDETVESFPFQRDGLVRDPRFPEGQKTSFVEKPSKYIMPVADLNRMVLRSRQMEAHTEEGPLEEEREDGLHPRLEASRALSSEADSSSAQAETSPAQSADASAAQPDLVPSNAMQDEAPSSSLPDG